MSSVACTAVSSHHPPLDDRRDHQHGRHRHPHGDLDEPHLVREPGRTPELVTEADQQGGLDQPDRAVDQLEPEQRVLAASDREVDGPAQSHEEPAEQDGADAIAAHQFFSPSARVRRKKALAQPRGEQTRQDGTPEQVRGRVADDDPEPRRQPCGPERERSGVRPPASTEERQLFRERQDERGEDRSEDDQRRVHGCEGRSQSVEYHGPGVRRRPLAHQPGSHDRVRPLVPAGSSCSGDARAVGVVGRRFHRRRTDGRPHGRAAAAGAARAGRLQLGPLHPRAPRPGAQAGLGSPGAQLPRLLGRHEPAGALLSLGRDRRSGRAREARARTVGPHRARRLLAGRERAGEVAGRAGRFRAARSQGRGRPLRSIRSRALRADAGRSGLLALRLPHSFLALAEAQVAGEARPVSGGRRRRARPSGPHALRVRRRADRAGAWLRRRPRLLRAELQRRLRRPGARPAPAPVRRGRPVHSRTMHPARDQPGGRAGDLPPRRAPGLHRRADLAPALLRGAAGGGVPGNAPPEHRGLEPISNPCWARCALRRSRQAAFGGAAATRSPAALARSTGRRCRMRRTFALFSLAFASFAPALMAALLPPLPPQPVPPPPPVPQAATPGRLRLQALLERLYLPEDRTTSAYLQIDLAAAGEAAARPRVPVNAVLIIDRSGSMSGVKIARARDAARALVQVLGPDDRLGIVEFSSGASVLVRSTAVTRDVRAQALAAIERIEAAGGTNMSAAFDAAAPELARGRAARRMDKVFLASDGQANEGIADREGLLRLARRDFVEATISTFGIGDDYDEDLMYALARPAGGRARYIDSPQILAAAFRDELSRAAALVARGVRLRVTGASGSSINRVLGYEADGGWIRVPDFAAGEERRVLVKLSIPPGRGLADVATVELAFEDARGEEQRARTVAQATFTSDASLLALAPTEAAASGTRAEMAELADQAARLQEAGRRGEAQARVAALQRVAARPLSPPRPKEIARAAAEYETDVGAIEGAGGAASKKLKQRVFDAVRAPVAGW